MSGREEKPPARSSGPAESVYARKATGMVREVSLMNMLAFNGAATGGGAAVILAIGLFFAFGSFPGVNLILDLVLAILVAGFVWVAFSLMAATFPKAGGDYLFGSRVIHPIAGSTSNLGTFLSTALSAGFWGWLAVTLFIIPTFGIIGAVTGAQWWIDASETLAKEGWTLAIAIALIVLVSILSAVRTRVIARLNTALFAVGMIGFVISLLIMLFKSHDGFVESINSFSEPFTNSANTYQDTIEAGSEAGLIYPDDGGYSVRSTIGGLYVGLIAVLYAWWGIYMAGEMKGAGRRQRQLATMVGSGYLQAGLVLAGALIFLGTAGYEFFAAANAGSYAVPVSPYFTFFAAVASGSDFVAILLGLSFLCFILPGMYINFAMCQRALFAWSFDGLIPRRASAVSERTHTPVVAIAIVAVLAAGAAVWVTYSEDFITVLAVTGVLLSLPIIVTGVAAILMPWRRPEVFAGSAADWTVRGVKVLPVAGVGCLLVGLIYIGLAMWFHTELGITGAHTIPILLVGCMLLATVYYYSARHLQRSEGVDLDLVYKTIPPD